MAAEGLLVAGVGRSGTSVATRLALDLGLRGPADDDLMAANEANPHGYWESNSLAVLNDRILDTWGSTWWTPPAEVTADMAARLRRWAAVASSSFRRSFGPDPGWVWKDPRLTLLLGFWTELLGRQPVLVPARRPQAVAASIAARDDVPYDSALRIWERHTRNLLRSIEGRTVLVLEYDDLLRDPGGWLGILYDFCRAAGLPVSPPTSGPGEIVHRPRPEPDGPLSDRQLELSIQLRSLIGHHDRFPRVDPGPETDWPEGDRGEEFDVSRVQMASAPRDAGSGAASSAGPSPSEPWLPVDRT